LRVSWPGFLYFKTGERNPKDNVWALLILHGRPKHYSEYAKELLARPNFRSGTVKIYDDAAPQVLTKTPTERPSLILVGYHLQDSFKEIAGDISLAMCWPFKRLHYYDQKIRNALHLLKTQNVTHPSDLTLDPMSNGDEQTIRGVESVEQKPELSEGVRITETLLKIKNFEALIDFVDNDLTPI
jgi:hypothetical protein